MQPREVVQSVILFLVIVFVIIGLGYVQNRVDAGQLQVICTSVRANIDQLTALHEIADQLGVPVEFKVPEVPAECIGT